MSGSGLPVPILTVSDRERWGDDLTRGLQELEARLEVTSIRTREFSATLERDPETEELRPPASIVIVDVLGESDLALFEALRGCVKIAVVDESVSGGLADEAYDRGASICLQATQGRAVEDVQSALSLLLEKGEVPGIR